MISNRKTFCVFHLFHKYLIQYSSCTTRITCCKHREKKESSPNYFHKAVRWGCFLFSVYSILMIKYSFRRLHFLFSPCFSVCTSSTYARVSCRNRLFVVSGKGSSGLSPHFHFIAGSILAIKPCLSQALPFFAPETKTTDPTEKRIKKCRICEKQGKRKN